MSKLTGSGSRTTVLYLILLGLITLAAFVLRFWQLDSVPPGWRDDELINSLVISQKVVDGDLAVYYADASGHEALYHALNAFMLATFGPGVAGIRWLSALLGTLTIPLTYLVGRRLFGSLTGLIAAAALAVSFWSLMYSRVGIRHILTPVLALATFYFFLRGLGFGPSRQRTGRSHLLDFLLAALFMSLGFYTYFASRGVPLILAVFTGYLFLFARDTLKKRWRGMLLMFVLAALLALPLLVTLNRQPESEARVAELAVPLVEGRVGNFEPLLRHISVTLSMFHADGDDEWLYNIPHRPLFGPLGALFFWLGVLLALGCAIAPLYRFLLKYWHKNEDVQKDEPADIAALSSAFLLIWWLGGISPGFISVPPASLGHTILAQPAVYLLAALPIWWLAGSWFQDRRIVPVALGVLLVASIALRDIPDYFQEWPQRGMTRFLYRAEIHEVAGLLNENPHINEFGITGLLAGPWDRLALAVDLTDARAADVAPRWYNPERVLLLKPSLSFSGYPELETPYADYLRRVPDVAGVGGYRLYEVAAERPLNASGPLESSCFENGLCVIAATYDSEQAGLELDWLVKDELVLPEIPLISNPPPPGVYSGPRLSVFAQLQDEKGDFLVGDDGFWVDPLTLLQGDRFLQQHWLEAPDGQDAEFVVFGLYDPQSGERILTLGGQDHIRLEIER